MSQDLEREKHVLLRKEYVDVQKVMGFVQTLGPVGHCRRWLMRDTRSVFIRFEFHVTAYLSAEVYSRH